MTARLSCCKDMREAMESEFDSNFLVQNDVLYLTVGTVETPQGRGSFDMAVRHCPFCGVELQTVEDIAKAAKR